MFAVLGVWLGPEKRTKSGWRFSADRQKEGSLKKMKSRISLICGRMRVSLFLCIFMRLVFKKLFLLRQEGSYALIREAGRGELFSNKASMLFLGY